MEDFELLRYVTIGQYVPGESIVHRLDPRAKISAFLFLTLAVTFSRSYTANAILLLVTLCLVLLARISLRFLLTGLKPALPFILLLALMQLLFYGNAYAPYGMMSVTLFRWSWIHITNGSIQAVIISMSRFVELLFLTSLLTNTTLLTDLTHGIEAMLRPFGRLGLPAHELSLVATVALRFLPLLAEQLENIMKAQASRGARIAQRGRLQFVATAQQVAVLIVPLFLDAFRRAEDLILAMQARCYAGGRARTSYVRLHFARADYVIYTLVLTFSAAMLVLRNWFPV
jgi:energy-coupling factor transport system permease protein